MADKTEQSLHHPFEIILKCARLNEKLLFSSLSEILKMGAMVLCFHLNPYLKEIQENVSR